MKTFLLLRFVSFKIFVEKKNVSTGIAADVPFNFSASDYLLIM